MDKSPYSELSDKGRFCSRDELKTFFPPSSHSLCVVSSRAQCAVYRPAVPTAQVYVSMKDEAGVRTIQEDLAGSPVQKARGKIGS